jgi:hypothetical protein
LLRLKNLIQSKGKVSLIHAKPQECAGKHAKLNGK